MDKIMPHNVEAEDGLLGALLLDGSAIKLVAEKIKPEDFWAEENSMIYNACLNLGKRREAINQITVAQELDRQGELESCGGASYLSHLISVCPTPLDIEYYADIVRRLSTCRRMIDVGAQIASLAYDSPVDINDMIDKGFNLFDSYRKDNITFDELITPHQAADNVLELIDKYNEPGHAIEWGFKDIDNITTGIYPEFIIIGARPSVGKTQLMKDIAENIAKQGKTILFASAEMSISALMERKIARELGISVREIRRDGIPDEYMGRIVELSGQVSESKIYYLPRGVSSGDVYNQVRRMKETIGLDILFVDYLQFLTDCWVGRENQNVRVGVVCKRLKSIVNDFDIPVVVASQLNRTLEYRSQENKKPTLADLRDSGNIEQDADVVLLLWRDEDDDRILEVKMAKHRQLGSAPAIKLVWLPERNRYGDIVR